MELLPPDLRGDLPLWHVTLTLAGEPVDIATLRTALERLVMERPFMGSARYAPSHAEVRYWDEAECLDDAAALAMRVWGDHRGTAGLPRWTVVGLEVLDVDTLRRRSKMPVDSPVRRASSGSMAGIGDVRPL